MQDGLTLTRPHATVPPAIVPPAIHGTARIAALAFGGWPLDRLLAAIGPEPAQPSPAQPSPAEPSGRAAWLMDRALAHALTFGAAEAAAMQAEALASSRVFRLHGEATGPRLLALMAPGDLMVNAPLDFLTAETDIQLHLAFTAPDGTLPDGLPDHDVAIVAVSESAPGVLAALPRQLAGWPRPVLNDPAHIARLSRDGLPALLADAPGLTVAPAAIVSRAALRRQAPDALLPGGMFPVLVRPMHSHGGAGLMKVSTPDDMALFLLTTPGDAFHVSQFIDYRGPAGWYCKYRIALIDRKPFICHMAASERWMVHYLNAGMDGSAAKRAAEAAAMTGFDAGFAARHAAAFAALCGAVGLDYFSIDCAEAPDGSLLVFEADVAAIIHSMDDPAVYPYKRPVMQLCYDAFAGMVRRRVAMP